MQRAKFKGKATFHLTISIRGQRATSKIKGKATFHLTISIRGQRATGKIQRKGYFSLNDFYACAACNEQNSKERLLFT